MRAGTELAWSVCMLRKIWLEDMVRVSFDAPEKVVVSSQQYWTVRRWPACRFCSSPTIFCDVATNQDVRGRQLNTCQTTMVPRTGFARWPLRGIRRAPTWSACRASAALASRTACWTRMTATQSRDRHPSTCQSVWRRGLANWTRAQCPAAVAAAPPYALPRTQSLSSCPGLTSDCWLLPMLVDGRSHSGTRLLRRPPQPNRCHPQT